MRSMRMSVVLALVTVGLLLVAGIPAQASIVFNVFTDPHPTVSGGTIGFAYAGDMFVGSVQKDGMDVLYSTDLNGGNVQLFAPTVSLSSNPASEHFVTSSLGLGGFPNRDIYVASANGVEHITHDASSSDLFVSGLTGAVRGILFDAVGTFNNDMLITTNAGKVYRVDSKGNKSLLASVGEDTEGLDVAPLGNGFSTFDGQLIVASEGTGTLRAISTGGVVTSLAHADSAEELTFVPLNLCGSGNPVEGFYGANYTQNVIKADCAQFASMKGDIVVTEEFNTHRVFDVHWDGTNFVVSKIGNFSGQPEDGIFVTAAIIQGSAKAVPEPGTLSLLGTGLVGLGIRARNRYRR